MVRYYNFRNNIAGKSLGNEPYPDISSIVDASYLSDYENPYPGSTRKCDRCGANLRHTNKDKFCSPCVHRMAPIFEDFKVGKRGPLGERIEIGTDLYKTCQEICAEIFKLLNLDLDTEFQHYDGTEMDLYTARIVVYALSKKFDLKRMPLTRLFNFSSPEVARRARESGEKLYKKGGKTKEIIDKVLEIKCDNEEASLSTSTQ